MTIIDMLVIILSSGLLILFIHDYKKYSNKYVYYKKLARLEFIKSQLNNIKSAKYQVNDDEYSIFNQNISNSNMIELIKEKEELEKYLRKAKSYIKQENN